MYDSVCLHMCKSIVCLFFPSFFSGGLQYQVKKKAFVKSNIAIVPSNAYVTSDNHSRTYIIWLEWLTYQNPDLVIQHALTGRGEYRIPNTNYRVDGFCHETNTVYEYLGELIFVFSQNPLFIVYFLGKSNPLYYTYISSMMV